MHALIRIVVASSLIGATKQQIEQYLGQQNRHAETELFVNTLKAKGKIEILI